MGFVFEEKVNGDACVVNSNTGEVVLSIEPPSFESITFKAYRVSGSSKPVISDIDADDFVDRVLRYLSIKDREEAALTAEYNSLL